MLVYPAIEKWQGTIIPWDNVRFEVESPGL